MTEQDEQLNLQPDEELKLHQLRIKEYWFNKQSDKVNQSSNQNLIRESEFIPVDQKWVLMNKSFLSLKREK